MRLSHAPTASGLASTVSIDCGSDPELVERSHPTADIDADVGDGLGIDAAAVVETVGVCLACAGGIFSLLARVARRRRPNTQGTLARAHRSHGSEPSDSGGTVHLSLWSRHRSQDDLMDWRLLVPVVFDGAMGFVV